MSPLRAFLLLALINVIWGASPIVAKAALAHYDSWSLSALRMGVSAVVLWLFQLRHGPSRAEAARVPRAAVAGMLAIGMFGMGLELQLQYAGLQLTSPSKASLLVIGELLFTAVVATVIFRERLGRARAAAVFVGAVGVVILVGGGALHHGPDRGGPLLTRRMLGDLLLLLSTFVEAIYTVLGARLARRYPAHVVLTWTNTG